MGPALNHLTDLHPLPQSQFIQQGSNSPGMSQHSHMDNHSPSNPFHIKGRHGDRSQSLCQGIRPIQQLLREPPVHGWEGPLRKRPQAIQRSFIIFPFWESHTRRASKNCTRQLGSFTSAGQCPSYICRTIGDALLKVTTQCLTAHLLGPRRRGWCLVGSCFFMAFVFVSSCYSLVPSDQLSAMSLVSSSIVFMVFSYKGMVELRFTGPPLRFSAGKNPNHLIHNESKHLLSNHPPTQLPACSQGNGKWG